MTATPQPAVRIRPADRRDLPAVVDLRRQVGWSSGGLEGTFSAATAGQLVLLVAEREGEVVGAVSVAFHRGMPAGRAHISDLLVAPAWRRRGIGTALLAAAEAEGERRGLRECTLDVDAHNAAALALYARCGYTHYRPAQFPWGPGHTLRKPLTAPASSRPRLDLLARLRWRLR